MFNYNNAPGTLGNADHSSFFNGDEIHIQLALNCYVTLDGATGTNRYYGYNFIEPKIELYDGNTLVSSDKLHGLNLLFLSHLQSNQATQDDYLWQQTTPSDMGGDFYDQAGQNDLSYVTDGSVKKCVRFGTQSSSTVTFPSTDLISSLSGPDSSDAGSVKIVVGASFKFRDPNQQDINGNYIGSGAGIEEVKVISDLRVRVSNDKPRPTSGYEVGNSTNYSLRNALWEVEEVLIKKGFGVIAPHVDEVQEIITFDDPLAGGIQSYTVADLIADPNAQLNSSGQWVLNQGDIDLQQNVSTSSQPAIPGYNIPAWVEVDHSSIAPWSFGNNVGTGGGYNSNLTDEWITSRIGSWFGNNNLGTNSSATLVDGTTKTWRLPPGFNTTTGTDTQPGNAQTWPFNNSGLTLGENTFSAQGQGTPGDPVTQIYPDVVSNYWRINQSDNSGNSAYAIHCPLGAGENYVVGDWYFIDIEYANNASDNGNKNINNSPNVGSYGLPGATNDQDGVVEVAGVANPSATNGTIVDNNGVGTFGGGPSSRHIRLVPTYRKEYGDDRWVLRAIYQVHSNSNVANNHLNYFSLRFYNFKNDTLFVSKIISKKINYVNGTGTATNWDIDLGNSTYDQLHTFSDGVYNPSTDDYSNVYFHGQKLCWENAYGNEDWSQKFQNVIPQTADTTPAQDPNWTLKFTVGPNPKTGLAVGELGLAVSNSIGDSVIAR